MLGIKWYGVNEYWCELTHIPLVSLIIYTTLALILLILLSSRLGINLSSMHLFYEGRVAAAYLMEGSLSEVDINLAKPPMLLHALRFELRMDSTEGFRGPYLLLNASLNLPRIDDLAVQERLATNFLFSPSYCGYTVVRKDGTIADAFQPTESFAYDGGQGIRLAQAVSISGSALSTNMGRASSARVRFLHSVFNLRLGWWLSNPGYPGAWEGNVPRARTHLLWKEVRGTSDEKGPYIHLSDADILTILVSMSYFDGNVRWWLHPMHLRMRVLQ